MRSKSASKSPMRGSAKGIVPYYSVAAPSLAKGRRDITPGRYSGTSSGYNFATMNLKHSQLPKQQRRASGASGNSIFERLNEDGKRRRESKAKMEALAKYEEDKEVSRSFSPFSMSHRDTATCLRG